MVKPQCIKDMSAEEYHALPYANASSLKAIRKSVRHMLTPYARKHAFDLGTAIHTIVLEGKEEFLDRHPVRPECWNSWRTNDAKAWRAEQESAGRLVVDPSDRRLAARLAREVSQCDAAKALLDRSTERRELTYIWHDETYDVPCKCRFDAVAVDGGRFIGIDLKSTRSALPYDFRGSIVKFGYDVQASHYSAGFKAVEGEDLLAYTIIAVETQEPHGVAVYSLKPEVLERGEWERELAMQKYADWHHDGRPTDEPVYPTHIMEIGLPKWAA